MQDLDRTTSLIADPATGLTPADLRRAALAVCGYATDAGVATFVPGPAPDAAGIADPDAVAAWLATARILPVEELESR